MNEPSRKLLNLHDYEVAARRILPRPIYDFVAGGSADEWTLRANRTAFDQWCFVPRVMQTDVSTADLSTSLLGQPIASPIVIAPTSLHRMLTAEGEIATAKAAKRAGTIYTMSTAASLPIEQIAAEAGVWWFQVYLFKDRGLSADLVRRAVAAGASAIVFTVDLARFGRREADIRNQFGLPDGITMPNLPNQQVTDDPDRNPGNLLPTLGGDFESNLGWPDLEWMAKIAGIPVLLKGVLHPDDARLAAEHGASGVVVSNHGGRQLDGAISSILALPAIAEAIDGQIPVLVDGGFRRGGDVLKALALGADAVMLGRPICWGLAVDGKEGAEHVLGLLTAELESDLALCGVARTRDISSSMLRTTDCRHVERTQ